jgi:aminopeptidase YwaD
MQPGFGYDYFADHYGEERTRSIKILQYKGPRAGGAEYAYEALNFVDGKRSLQEIRDAVSAEYGPIPLDVVAEYLRALESIGVLYRAK